MSLAEVEAWVGRPLPEPYRAWLAARPDDLALGERVLLYGRASFVERNETYETRLYSPGHVTIGDDSGGGQLLLALEGGAVSLVDAGSMAPSCARPLAADVGAWLAAGGPLDVAA